MRMLLIIVAGVAVLAGLFTAYHYQTPVSTQIHNPEQWLQTLKNDPKAPYKIYQQFCSTCHAADAIVQVNAPRYQTAADWQKYSTLDDNALLTILKQGIGQMPPRGGCFECTDAQLAETIKLMRRTP